MKTKRIIWMWLGTAALMCWLGQDMSMGAAPKYTAKVLIEVLPYVEQDPMSIGTPVMDKDIQFQFRRSMATLIRHQSTLEELIDRPKVQDTKWFRNFGDVQRDRAECVRNAINDLGQNLRVHAQQNTNYVELLLSCAHAEEAALIVNEAVDLFVASRARASQSEIEARLATFEDRRRRIESELHAAEASLEDVRARWGFSGLEQRRYPHPTIARLNRLEEKKDELVLETEAVEVRLKILEARGGAPDQLKDELVILQSKLKILQAMVAEAEAKRKDFGAAQVQYEQRAVTRNERRKRLGEVKSLVEKLKLMHGDPRTAKVQPVGLAVVPLEPDGR
jgi:uncharacterized protein involved in exopolysaccharide biosynthesis